MSTIKKVEFTYRKKGTRYNSTIKRWIGHQIDIRGLNGKRIRTTFATKIEAEKFITQLESARLNKKAGLAPTVTNIVRIDELFDKRLAQIKNAKESVRAKRVFKDFLKLLGHPPKVIDVRTVHFQMYINARLETEVKPATVNREVTVLSSAFKQASSLFPQELENYEAPKIPRARYRKTKRHRPEILERDKDLIIQSILNDRSPKEHAIRTNSRPAVAGMFELAWLLGLRFSEAKRLLKSDFNASARSLRVVRWKTDSVDLLEYLPDRVVELLQGSDSPTEYIFDVQCSDHTVAAILKDACEANGIVYGRGVGYTFHDTRHSFITRLVRVTDLATAQSFSGHSDTSMVAHYSHASGPSKRKAMERMYGGGLREIYDKVKDGVMTFEEFEAAVR